MSVRAIISSVVLVILIAASSAVDIGSDESIRIRMVPDSLQEIEESFVQVLGQSRQVLSFARFTHQYGKKYQNVEEIKHRFSVFKENLALIRSTNKKGLSYKLGVNQFADQTFRKFERNKTNGAIQYPFASLKGSPRLTETVVPETRDWRQEGIVTPVKDQGQCGAGWAFSTIGAVEALHEQYYGSEGIFSEQQLIDCTLDQPYGNAGCDGGLPSAAFLYIIDSGGVSLAYDYPYTDSVGPCYRSNPNFPISGYVSIPSGDEDELKKAVGSIGPVSISFNVVDSLRLYQSGVYTSSECGNALNDVNHFALAVGYGIEDGVPYWLIKNSWGEKWGDGGYFKVERGKNICGVATLASYPVAR